VEKCRNTGYTPRNVCIDVPEFRAHAMISTLSASTTAINSVRRSVEFGVNGGRIMNAMLICDRMKVSKVLGVDAEKWKALIK
jgi:hypothetical protein